MVIAALALAIAMRRQPALQAQSKWLLGLTALQVATGLSNVVLDWPLLAAVLHTGGAAALVTVMTWALAATRCSPAPQQEARSGARRVSA